MYVFHVFLCLYEYKYLRIFKRKLSYEYLLDLSRNVLRSRTRGANVSNFGFIIVVTPTKVCCASVGGVGGDIGNTDAVPPRFSNAA